MTDRDSAALGNGLQWERREAPEGVGICLSGGGIRAAAFAIGVTQALQAERGLLFGPTCADYLSVVSGGSYAGAALTLNAAARELGGTTRMAPMADGSPEAEHVMEHGRYLLAGGVWAIVQFGLAGAVNLSVFVALSLWVGTMVSVYAYLVRGTIPAGSGDWAYIGVIGLVVGGRLLLRGIYVDGGVRRTLLPILGLAIVGVSAPAYLASMHRARLLSDTAWWTDWRHAGICALAGVCVVAAWIAAARVRPHHVIARVLGHAALLVPRVSGFVLLALAATWAQGFLAAGVSDTASADGSLRALILFFGILLGAVCGQIVGERVSLHRIYRNRIATCFAIRRTPMGDGVTRLEPTATPMSALQPPAARQANSFPRLLICATANVLWRDLQHASRRSYAPFVFSHDQCGLVGVPGASFSTTQLEAGKAAAGLGFGSEPLVSLMTAVASTGAAVSPTMGNHTIRQARPLLAVLNLRLGQWMPNPLSGRIRDDVREANEGWSLRKRQGIGGGYDEFVPELFGLHGADAPRVYVSDGGHYDNLGLLVLLSARCKEIWCIDSEADPHGAGRQLRRAIELAPLDLGVTIDFDPSVFRAVDGVLGATHAIGTIRYGPEGTGRLIVVKLGVTTTTSLDLLNYHRQDGRFPCDSTFLRPAFGPERMRAYCQLGRENALRTIADVASATPTPEPSRRV
jgi:hypothetical protein